MRIHRGHHTDLDYHRRLLDDLWRVDAYDRALRAVIAPGDVVLDLGTGTGLLAMLAARLGARVHAIESAAVGAVAERLIAHNGLSDRIVLHRADAVTLDPAEPVDLVVGEWMGRFVVDDAMLDAVEAAGRWLKPGGRFAPSRIRMQLAPAGDFAVPMVDRWRTPLLGLDLSPALPLALNTCYGVALPAAALLAAPADYAAIVPPRPPERFAASVAFQIARDGLFRGVIGFWEAELAPGIALSTAPGRDTHWGQYLFPAEPIAVRAGDRVSFRLELDTAEAVPVWDWEGVLSGHATHRWSGRSTLDPESLPSASGTWTPDRAAAVAASNTAAARFAAGQLDEATGLWTEAVRGLGPEDADLVPTAYENLGIGRLNTGAPLHAAQAFLRALDGGLEPAQSAALIELALAHAHRPMDLAWWKARRDAD